MKQKNNKKMLISGMALCLSLAICIGIAGMVGLVYGQADPALYETYTISYDNGDAPDDMAFTPKDGVSVLDADASNCITLPETFANTVTVAAISDARILDEETFYFAEPTSAAIEDGSLWAYTFTGWKVVGQENKIAGETVFQPGFTISPEVLLQYAPDGNLHLEAQWGKCYFIQNPYEAMNYEEITRYYPTRKAATGGGYEYFWQKVTITAVNTNTSGAATGATDIDNIGNNPNKPLASVHHLYTILENTGDPYDACATAVVLTMMRMRIMTRLASIWRTSAV